MTLNERASRLNKEELLKMCEIKINSNRITGKRTDRALKTTKFYLPPWQNSRQFLKVLISHSGGIEIWTL